MKTAISPRRFSVLAFALPVGLAAQFFGISDEVLASPPARAWHAFTDNGSATSGSSRLYLFGGAGAEMTHLNDFWYYRADLRTWTPAPVASTSPKSRPGPRSHAGLSCANGQCVTSNGINISSIRETWVYTESTAKWAKLKCNVNKCPSARWAPAMAYDPSRSYHLLFGGISGSNGLNDTHSFDGGPWVKYSPANKPSARRSAAMTFVPSPVNKVVLFGGQKPDVSALCDMWAWTGSNWTRITTSGTAPCLHSHSIAWTGDRLLITGGYLDISDAANHDAWEFRFDNATSGRWTRLADTTGCYASVQPGARMAYDRPSGLKVFFGGERNGPNGVIRYADTALCG